MEWSFNLVTIGILCDFIATLSASFLLYRLYRRNRLQIILIWAASFIMLGVGVLFILAGVVYPMLFSSNEDVSMFFFRTGMCCLTGMVLLSEIFMIYIEYGAMKTRIPLALVAGTLTGLFIGSVLSPSMFWLKEFDVPKLDFISLRFPVLAIGGLLLLYFTLLLLMIFGRMVRDNKHADLRKKLQFMLFGYFINSFGLLISQAWGILSNNLFINFLYPYIGTVGILIFIKGLKTYPNFLIYLKQKVYRLILFQRGGEVLYIYRFRHWPAPAREENYVVASLVGVGSFLQTTLGLGSEADFDTINIEDTKLISEFRGNLGFALIISEYSPILRETLHRFVDRIIATNIFEFRDHWTIEEFEKAVLPGLNAIVEEIFFFSPEKE